MAPNMDNNFLQKHNNNNQKPSRLSMEGLQRTISDISFELMSQEALAVPEKPAPPLPTISEVEDAKCECCGMLEECTPQYVKKVRGTYGQMICGLCSEAVKEEMEKNGGKREEALHAHVSVCARFNRLGRAYPVLCQAEVMRDILRKNRAKSLSPRDKGGTNQRGGIARSSSCIPAITKEINDWKKA
ncbi:hypothetical protein SASPL_153196 [Salvia splendens]|uniref:DUF1677 domain-containing protein n=1 Tax=Salvia splendens TaxID=180675 RepID=A0A8X8W548_SALSN|nr:uncharacterized protein LOC121783952 [Salvia splendens]KAG6387999.1 hypothetical protein SASPL_153196 [Salvia splendens]